MEKIDEAAPISKTAWAKALRLDSTRDNVFYTKAERIRDILWSIKRNLIYRFFRFFRLVPDIDKIARECVGVLPLDVLDGYPGERVNGEDHPGIPDSVFLKFEDRKVGEPKSVTLPLIKELKGEPITIMSYKECDNVPFRQFIMYETKTGKVLEEWTE